MRNYQYSPEQESQMDDFGNEYKKLHRGVKGPSAWREFKKKNPWAQKITSDALRQKYIRMKRDQYWRNYALAHAACPMGHTSCLAANPITDFAAVRKSIEEYVSRSTETINPSTIVMPFGPVIPSIVFAPAYVIVPIAPTVAAISPDTPAVDVIPEVPTVDDATNIPTVAVSPGASADAVAIEDNIPAEVSTRSVVTAQKVNGNFVSLYDFDNDLEDTAVTIRDIEAEEDELIPLNDGCLMLVSRNDSKNISSVQVCEVFHQARRVLMHRLWLKCKEFEHRFSILALKGPSKELLAHLSIPSLVDLLADRLLSIASDDNNDALKSALVSRYMSGFHAGYLRAASRRNCQTSGAGSQQENHKNHVKYYILLS
uniref:Uncharacterized protein n=1 Tax=Ditylenchus dipsaci TaxID=166011 RepID=A0A915E8T5_9BILA